MIHCRFLSSVFFLFALSFCTAQNVLSPEKLTTLLPIKVKGFYADGDAKHSMIKIGTLRYAMCERSFSRGSQQIKFLLFDYAEAPIMYTQAMRNSNQEPIKNDSIILQNIVREGGIGWEVYNKKSGTSQIFMGIHNRYFLLLAGEQVEPDRLKEILDTLTFSSFPKKT